MSNNYVWTTKEGESIHIVDMETSHLMNTIKYIEGKGFEYIIKSGGGRHEDGDMWYNEEVIDLLPIYENMRIELRIRKLEAL